MSNAVNASGGVHLSVSQRVKLRALARARVETPGRGTSALGEATGLDDDDTAALVPLLGSPIPLDAGLDERGSLAEILADRDAEEMLEEALVAADVDRVLGVAERVLGDRERLVLEARFGLSGREPETLRQVAERLGVSVQRVAQIERSALDRLRAVLEVPSPS
jgi:RNA polymerase sigma factor (sigma-70 family)